MHLSVGAQRPAVAASARTPQRKSCTLISSPLRRLKRKLSTARRRGVSLCVHMCEQPVNLAGVRMSTLLPNPHGSVNKAGSSAALCNSPALWGKSWTQTAGCSSSTDEETEMVLSAQLLIRTFTSLWITWPAGLPSAFSGTLELPFGYGEVSDVKLRMQKLLAASYMYRPGNNCFPACKKCIFQLQHVYIN